MHGEGVFIQRVFAGVGLHGVNAWIRAGIQSGEIHHPPPIGVAKVLAGIVEGLVVHRASMHVDDQDPAKTQLPELVAEIHEYGA